MGFKAIRHIEVAEPTWLQAPVAAGLVSRSRQVVVASVWASDEPGIWHVQVRAWRGA